MANNPRLQQAVKALVLIALALFLYTRFTSGMLYVYIAERFAWITVLAVFGFLAVGLSYDVRRSRSQAAARHDLAGEDHAQHDHDAHDHGGHNHMIRWSAIGLVALPILLGTLISPRPLGAAALANREVAVNEPRSALPALVRAAQQKPSTELNVLEWQQVLATTDLSALSENDAQVVGFVFRDDRFGEDQFFLARFTVSCCVADAAVAGLVVQGMDAATWQTDEWVQVQGEIVEGTFNGAAAPVLQAASIVPTETPSQPYLYP
jgi:uncharacterized repeat protein (TIGR03943 family)